ncbi:MAG TPA: transposase [Noviherbaspirillum sp.]|jgi:transposase|uniref:transposase n=1 Tax=Noviherbaspirillum sp. TaxID=1926288 RepID=UPI002DDCC761|nr:transposase [Noviherbaspirillum sp.]HEV2609040.1 transposase [Noviherbaspirillum sp.]
MARELVNDKLWEQIEPMLPVKRRRKIHPGRKRLDDRRALTGILFVLQSGIPWEMLPQNWMKATWCTWSKPSTNSPCCSARCG